MFAHRLSTVVVSIVPGIGLAFPAQASAPAAARESSSPKTNVSAVRLTLTVVDPTRAGGIFVFHGGHDGKRISSVPFRPERTVGRVIVAPVGADGSIRLVNGSAGTVQLDADVAGYYRTDVTSPRPGSAVAISPQSGGLLLLQWTNPADPDFTGVMIRRSQGSVPPVSATDGTLVVDVAAPGETSTDYGLIAGTTYSYALSLTTGPRTTPWRRSAPPPPRATARCTGARNRNGGLRGREHRSGMTRIIERSGASGG